MQTFCRDENLCGCDKSSKTNRNLGLRRLTHSKFERYNFGRNWKELGIMNINALARQLEDKIVELWDWVKDHVKETLITVGVLFVLLIAVAIFTSSGSRYAPDSELNYLVAISRYATGDTTASIQTFLKLVETQPKSPEAKRSLFYLGHYNLQKGALEEAERYFKRFLDSGLDDPFMKASAYNGLATIAVDKKEYDRAISYLKKAEELNPFETYKAYYEYRMMKIYELKGENDKALEVAENFVEKYKEHPLFSEVSEEMRFLKGVKYVHEGSTLD